MSPVLTERASADSAPEDPEADWALDEPLLTLAEWDEDPHPAANRAIDPMAAMRRRAYMPR